VPANESVGRALLRGVRRGVVGANADLTIRDLF
jgi:hypothetical protein